MRRTGLYDRRISIEYKSVEQEETYGTETITWLRLTLGWAQVTDVLPSRSEAVAQGLNVARNQVRIRMPYRGDVTSDMRIVVHGNCDEVYQIVGGPAMLGRMDVLEMVCERFSS